ncbi:MAG TPA: acyl-CoA dehydrogenase [Kiloniellaceae bacterium]|nr:acyl-CoA dehydrogenase [Kiloniellaceae bacterium]
MNILCGLLHLRQRYISTPLLRQFRRAMPAISRTEREALNAGDVGWEGDLFSGRPDWRSLLDAPPARLSMEEQAFLDGPVEELCRRLDDWRITHERCDLPEEIWRFIKASRMFGMIIPKEYGGLAFSAYAHSCVVMKIASRSVTAAVTVMVPNSLGPAKLLLHYGTEEQKSHYLPRLARGEEIPCFALTGPTAGSDAGALPDLGVVCRGRFNGEEITGIRLNWDKRYITLAPVATLIGLAFRLQDPDHLLGDDPDLGITVALIPSDTPGVEIGQRHIPLNIPFQNGPTRGHDVFIPLEWIIGGPERAGQGWRMLMESLAEGRGISLPALATGGGKAACRYTGAYAAVRRQFNLPIGRFEGVEEALARIAGRTYQMDAARRLILGALDQGGRPAVASAIVKYHLTERFRKVINDAMDIHGGSGICLGPHNFMGRTYQGIPIAITVEGANILTRSMIIFGQGAVRCHPWLLKEFEAAYQKDDRRSVAAFDRSLFGHIGWFMRNAGRSLMFGLTHGYLSPPPANDPNGRWFQQLAWMSGAFALCADVSLMTLGGSLKRKERLSARLGDILSLLYFGSAVLKQHHDRGHPEDEQPLVEWAMQDILHDIREAFRGLFANLPIRPLAWLMRLWTFPAGLSHPSPSDRLDHAVARLLLVPSPVRDRLTEGVFVSRDGNEPVGRLELALEAAMAAEPLERRLVKAQREGIVESADIERAVEAGLLTGAEASRVARARKLRDQVIAVDAFSKENVQHPETTADAA